ncbi:type IV secretion system DNA-binding domain-containing protein [Patescibacteria group bacterium]|nr:type IV secretion system DNA-binding domain-containing protein [Patescibacteria group bacterium]MBU4368075.1 type IV secretion system DNA-binding domain-containing protein [Patescibacteria group bacterium]MBU4462304.1 type IV secretion system DNA-binding domain-containing protein [Patescibacteria group bacterium]MCG2700353.1 type IV secretion system DNA-binding domain-containing protein [Candidatus Parcubacteria bacterium]
MNIIFLLLAIFVLLIAAVAVAFYFEKKEKKGFLDKLDMSLFLVMMPKHETKKEGLTQKEEKAMIGQMEQVFTNFLYLKKAGLPEKLKGLSPCIALEIASQIGSTDISFYVAVPKILESALEKYIQGVYPRALVEKVPQDYTIFEPGGVTAASYLKLSKNPFFPINTYVNLEKDPLSGITNTLNKITANEGVGIQVIIRPIDQGSWRDTGEKILTKIREGKSVRAAISEVSQGLFFKLLAGAASSKSKKITEPIKREPTIDQVGFEAIQNKIKKQVFETNIRLVVSAQTSGRAEDILNHLEGAFGQFSLSAINSLEPKRLRKKAMKKFIYEFTFRNFNEGQKNTLNLEELTSIYHFPTYFIETPYIKSIKSAVAPPPSDLPEGGLNLIGKVLFRGEEKKVYFASADDRRRHFYIIGQTGTGKSSLLQEMIRQDIQNGQGVAIIDPHGELVESTLANIPKDRIEDVVLFEPFDQERPIGLNMLEYESPEQKDFAVQEMIAIFYKLFPPEIIGPMFEHYMRNAMLAIMADKSNPGTLVEIPRMFTDAAFMEEKLKKITDHVVRDFWQKEWKQTTGNTRSDMLGYVVSKIGRFIENETMRNIIGQSQSGFDLGKIMDEGKIFLANLSKGLTGEVNSSLLGLILVSKMQMAAMRRARVSEEKRKDFYLYIDEFQNFTTDSIATILSEARKYKLNLILAHQYIPQLTQEIKNAVLGNVGTIGAFRISADDAELLEKQFEPGFSRFDLVNLDNFNLIIKMMINNKVSSPFKLEIIFPQKGKTEIIESIKKLSKLKYGRPKGEVEAEIAKRTQASF